MKLLKQNSVYLTPSRMTSESLWYDILSYTLVIELFEDEAPRPCREKTSAASNSLVATSEIAIVNVHGRSSHWSVATVHHSHERGRIRLSSAFIYTYLF